MIHISAMLICYSVAPGIFWHYVSRDHKKMKGVIYMQHALHDFSFNVVMLIASEKRE